MDWARGKSREEIFDHFGNKLEPVSIMPKAYLPLFEAEPTDDKVYSGKGYFIDHAVNHHANVPVSEYDNIQEVLDHPDSIKKTVSGSIAFIKKLNQYDAVLVDAVLDENGRILLHKTFFSQKKEPYAKEDDMRPENMSREGGTSSISHADSSAPAISLESRRDNGTEPALNNWPSSIGKDNKSSDTMQEKTGKVAEGEENSGHSIGATSSSEKKEAERQGVNTEPTAGQKEAGNYKKGHIKVDGYDITIENPKGSTRSGKDANGKEWSIKMNYDYGYIKGVTGVDGDHIDVYLSDNPTSGNVYVVDQIDQQTGKFDEHKVMYGFPSMKAAVEAYKSQYEKGWKVGTVTEVSREDFKKWIESSKRKTKPFSEYKSVKEAAARPDAMSLSVEEAEKSIDNISSEMKKVSEEIRSKHLVKVAKKFKLGDRSSVTPDWVESLDAAQRKTFERLERAYKKEVSQATEKFRIELQEAQLDLENAQDARHSDEVRKKFLESVKPKKDSIEARVLSAIENGDGYDFLYDLPSEDVAKVKDYSERISKAADDILSNDDSDAAFEALDYYTEEANDILSRLDNSDFETIEEDKSIVDKTGRHHLGQLVTFKGKNGIVCGFNGMGEVLVKVKNGSFFAISPDDTRLAAGRDTAGSNQPVEEPHFQKSDFKTPVDRSEAALRDGLSDLMRGAGIDVIDDEKEGQRVLDMANGPRLDKNKKRALETASLGTSSRSLTVIPSAGGAKVLNNLDTLVTKCENSATQPKTFVGDVAKALGIPIEKFKDKSSQYATFETKNGRIVTIRISDHNATASNLDVNGQEDAISIVVTNKPNAGITNDGESHIVEFYYNAIKLRKAEGKPLADIVRSIKQALYSGEFKDTTGLAERQEVNAGEIARQQKVYHGSGADFDHFDHSHMGEGEGAQAHGWGTYVTKNESVGRDYAEKYDSQVHLYYGGSETSGDDIELSIRNNIPLADDFFDEVYKSGSYYDKTLAERLNESDVSIDDLKEELESSLSSVAENYPENDYSRYDEVLQQIEEELDLVEKDEENPQPTIYTVDIPDDTGDNYLEEKQTLQELNRPDMSDRIDKVMDDYLGAKDFWHSWQTPGWAMREEFVRLAMGQHPGMSRGEANRKFSELLSKAGVVGMHYDGRKDGDCYVIFNDKDLKITDKVKFFRTANGEAYGFTVGGKIYIDPRIATSETPIHEYAHLWAEALRNVNPKEWANVVKLMKGTWAWDYVRKQYPELETDDEIAEEALAHFSGKRGAERLRQAAREEADKTDGVIGKAGVWSVFSRIKEALEKFWQGVSDFLHIHFTSAEEVADKVMHDLLNKVNPNTFNLSKSVEEGRDLIAVHNLTEDKLKQSLELGGFPMPSIAITKTSMGHTEYGDISLLFGKDTINPSDRRNKVYSGDAWTPTFPQVSYKLDEKKLDDIYSRALKVGNLPFFKSIRLEPENLRDRIDGKAPAEIIESSKKDYGMKQMFLTEKGNPVKEYVQITVDKYSPERVELLQQILDKFGVDGLKSGKYDDELKQIVGSHLHKDLDSVKPIFAKVKVQNALRDAIDFAENGNKKVEYNVKATQKEIDSRTDPKEYDQWLHEMFDGIIEKKGIRNNTDAYTRSGNRREWERLYDAVTLENILKAMKAQPAKSGSFFSSIFGASAKELSNLNEVREEAKRRIKSVPEEEFKAEKDKILSRLEKISLPSVESSDSISSEMDFVENVKDAVVHSHTPKGIYKYLSDFYPDMTMEVANEIAGVVKDIQAMSTRYLEAKPYRAVGFDEVRAAVVPSDTETRIVQQLKDKGIAVYSYERGNTEERRQVVNDAAQEQNVKFHKAESGNSKRAAENEVEAVNKRFDEELQEQIDGQQEPGHIYQLGRPSSVLLSTGIPDLPIQLSATRLKDKATSFGHDYALEDVKGLVNALQHPLAVFAYGNKEKAQNVIVELEKDGKNFIVGLSLRPVVNGRVLEINSIRNVFPKNNSEWLNWISQGKALYIDKKKVQDLIDKQRTILADVDYLDLNSVAKIINDFENPVIKDENFSTSTEDPNGDSVKYRSVPEGALLDFLNGQPTRKGFRYAQWANFGVLPPMTAKVDGEWRPPMIFSQWEQSEEGMRKANGKADLVQGNGRTTGDVAYNPYFHIRTSPLNDQFTAAYDRPELVVVEGEYPVSELTSGYHAQGAKNSVGLMDWHSGSVNGQLSDDTKVQTMLSRYFKPLRIVPWGEVADRIMERIGDQDITFPINAVPPMLRAELAKRGAKFGEISGQVKEDDIPMLEDLRKRINAGEWNAGLDKAKAYLDAYESSDEAKKARVEQLSAELNTPIKVVKDPEEIASLPSKRKRMAKGWFEESTGEVVVMLPNNVNVADVDNTVVHEVVGHYGLRKLIGEEHFNEFLDEVHEHAGGTVRKEIDKIEKNLMDNEVDRLTREKEAEPDRPNNRKGVFARAEATVEAEKKRQKFRRDATEEYMADMAGRIGNEGFKKMDREQLTFWGRVKAKVQQFLDKFLRRLRIPKSIKLSDKDVAYILYKSWKNLRNGGKPTIVDEAEDAVMQSKTHYNEVEKEHFRDGDKNITPEQQALLRGHNFHEYPTIQELSAAKIGNNVESVVNKGENVSEAADLGDKDIATNEDVMFRDGDSVEYTKAQARNLYEERVSRGLYQAQEALQDSMLGLREAMESILKAEGGYNSRIEDVAGYENPYLGENRLSSVNQAECAAFAQTLFKPMLEEVARLAKTADERARLTDYMMAKHGLERNEVMAQRAAEKVARDEFRDELRAAERTAAKDPLDQDAADNLADIKRRMQDRENELYAENRGRDYAGLTALTRNDDVADAENEAAQMVSDYEADHDTTNLWDKVNAVTKATLQKTYESGIISKATYDDISAMYKHYIPLRGFDEKTSDEAYAYLTDKHSAFNAPIKCAKGRKSKADDPFTNMEAIAESAIMQGNRNMLVKRKFMRFAQMHPSDLVSISDLWLHYDDAADEWRPVNSGDVKGTERIEEDDTPNEVERKMRDFEEVMRQLSENDPDHFKRQKDNPEKPYRVVRDRDLREHQVLVKQGGKDYVLTINGNPRAAQALNGQTNPDNDMSGALGAILHFGEVINRQLSAFYTTRNPDFVVSNFMRDMLYANTMVWVKESPNYAIRFHKNFAEVNPAKMKVLLSKLRKGTLDMNDETEKAFSVFIANGGETGYSNIRDIEQRKNDIRRELKMYNGKLPFRKAWTLFGERLDEYNRAVENCARFAAFMTSRQMKRSLDRSIWDAKEISVNFNKKGSGAKFMGATGQTKIGNTAAFVSGLGRSGFVFWNAAVQGTTNFGRQFKNHPVKALTAAATMFLLGALVSGIASDDDDVDNKSSYYNFPEYVRRSNIVFHLPGMKESWISIPLSVEYRAWFLATAIAYGTFHVRSAVVAFVKIDVKNGGVKQIF